MHRFPALFALLLIAAMLLAGPPAEADQDVKLFDRSLLRTVDGTAYIDTSAATYTAWTTLVTIAPDDNNAMQDVRIVVDLDKLTTGFADATGYDTETISLSIARKVDGTNWRTAANIATTALAADDADNLSIELVAGEVGPTEDLRVMVKLSAEAASDVVLPFTVYYRAAASATITPVELQ